MKETKMNLTTELITLLKDSGAKLVGIGDMQEIKNCPYPIGVAIAIPIPKNILQDLKDGPTKEYHDMYHQWNQRLNAIINKGVVFLQSRGYQAYGQTTDVVKVSPERIAPLPHKTVATRAGLGWIGKNCLLVTKEYGSAIRISSLLTDAPLIVNEPINESLCGNCHLCVDACPGHALKGTLWNSRVNRDDIIDKEACHDKQVEIMVARTGINQDLCGKCFAVCAYSQKYLHQ